MVAVDPKTLGKRLKTVREARNGDDMAMLAEELNIPPNTLSNYERGVVMPSCLLLEFIFITGANPYYLLLGTECAMFSKKFDRYA